MVVAGILVLGQAWAPAAGVAGIVVAWELVVELSLLVVVVVGCVAVTLLSRRIRW